MPPTQDTGDAWFDQHSGRPRGTRIVTRRLLYCYIGSLLMAVALLVSFYVVLSESVSRAHRHWAQFAVSQASPPHEACGSAARARDNCAGGEGGATGRRTVGLITTGR